MRIVGMAAPGTLVRRIPARNPARRRPLVAIGVALFLVVSFDAVVFRTPYYPSLLEPGSSTGLFELILWRERQAQRRYGDNVVLTIGDSRFGIAPKVSNTLTRQTGYVFRSAGVPGTDPRSWYYMVRDLDPSARRYRAILLGVNDYNDEDQAFEPDNDIRALHYCINHLRLFDIPQFASSFHDSALRWQAVRGTLLKGFVYQSDFQAFLSHPLKRVEDVRFQRHGVEEWTYNFLGTDRTMAGLTIDWTIPTAFFPPGADDNQQGTVQNFLLRAPVPQTGRFAAFRRLWLGKIIDRYSGSPTKLVFVRLPRGPIPRPPALARSTGSVIREFAARPNILLMDEHFFEPLERPELFGDGMHLNKAGVALFSTMLAKETSRLLSAQ